MAVITGIGLGLSALFAAGDIAGRLSRSRGASVQGSLEASARSQMLARLQAESRGLESQNRILRSIEGLQTSLGGVDTFDPQMVRAQYSQIMGQADLLRAAQLANRSAPSLAEILAQ